MQIARHIKPVCKERWENMMAEAEANGLEFIEVRHGKRGKVSETFRGLDQVVLDKMSGGRDGFDSYRVRIIGDGTFEMEADSSRVRWGYLLRTDKNEKWLALQVASGKLGCTDETIRRKAAYWKGAQDKTRSEDKNIDNYLKNIKNKKTKAIEPEVSQTNEADELKKQLEELKSQMLALTTAALTAKVEEPKEEEPKEEVKVEEKKPAPRRAAPRKK